MLLKVRAWCGPGINFKHIFLPDLPSLISWPQALVLLPGETAMFRCHSEGHPEVKYTWSYNGARVISSSRVRLYSNGEVLEIISVNQSDAGQYRCRAENVAGHVQSPFASFTVVTRRAVEGRK